jgi:serine/threonine-protein kinase
MIGSRLGPWIIERELGRGGMGTVYLARRATSGATPAPGAPPQAAVKVLAAELALEPGFLQRFQREIEVLRQLNHPHIVRFLEAGTEGPRYYYAMEHVAGPSFNELLERDGRLPWREVLDLAWQVAPALKHAHDRGVIHRDIKPANLLRGPAEQPGGPSVVKLTDFGIASLFASPHLTVTGGVIGTPEFLSPEQAAGKPVTRRSDLYSLGVVLYALVTGRTPFEGEPLDLLHKHRFAQFDRPGRVVPELPPDFDQIICDLLEKEPGKRPPDGGVLFRRLDSLKRKLERKGDTGGGSAGFHPSPPTVPLQPGEGPATLMSRLMRGELERQNRGGPVRRFFNRPVVLIPLFVLTVGLIAWSFWPLGAQTMYRRGAALMASSEPGDWDRAWDKYLGPLQDKYPNHPYQQEVAELRRKYEEKRAERQAEVAARNAGPVSEGQRFFQEGLRLRQAGDEAGARRTWEALIAGFGEVPSERPWARRAEKELQRPEAKEGAAGRQWRPLREAVRRARALRDEGKKDEAQAIREALGRLYHGDAAATKVLEAEWGKEAGR